MRLMLSDRTVDAETTLKLLGPINGNYGITLARMILAQQAGDAERLCAIRLLRVSSMGVKRLADTNREIALQLLLQVAGEMPPHEVAVMTGELAALIRLGDYPGRFLQLDLLNPWTMGLGDVPEELWLTAVNGIFMRSGLESIRLRGTGATAFDRLDSQPGTVVPRGPLVSVIMTCYNPGPSLVTAVRSMIAQTWQSWELIVTDDASPENPTEYLADIAAMDPRIHVIRNSENVGTYARRNEAIISSRGDFITMQDSDDWVHPRRLEIQMRHLIANDQSLANLSQSVRMSEDLMFVQPRGTSIRIAESSLLFRKEAVVSLIGYFDSVRKAADSEFRLRLEASLGEEIPIVEIEAPLSLVRFERESLSASDLGDGWMHPARIAYRGAQAQWRRERLDEGLPLVVRFPLEERPFPAHPHLAGGARPIHDVDVLFVLDTTGRGAAEAVVFDTLADICALLDAGLRIGVRRAIALGELRSLESTHEALQSLINAGSIVEALVIDETKAALVVVRHPDCLTGIGESEVRVETDLIVVVGGRRVIPNAYTALGLANLGADQQDVTWLTPSAWSIELAKLCDESVKSDTMLV
jgi:hypothetical protein